MNYSTVLQKKIDTLLTTTEICQCFRRTPMTIHLWRKHRGLPTVVIPGPNRSAIRFAWRDVQDWAKKNNVEIFCEPRS